MRYICARLFSSRFNVVRQQPKVKQKESQVPDYFWAWVGDLNTGKHNPNLVSIPAKEATAKRSPPIWSWLRDTSGLTGFISVFGALKIYEIKQDVKKKRTYYICLKQSFIYRKCHLYEPVYIEWCEPNPIVKSCSCLIRGSRVINKLNLFARHKKAFYTREKRCSIHETLIDPFSWERFT